MAIFAGESPLMLSGDSKKDLELIRNYIYERDMELRHILSHLDESNFVEGFADRLATVNNITNEYNEYNEIIEGGGDEPSGSVDLESATGILPVSNGGTGLATLTDGSFLVGNGTAEVELMTPASVLTNIGAQKKMAFATASTVTSGTTGTKDINLQTFVEGGDTSVFSNARYSSSYGYGIKCAKAGKYLISATANIKTTIAGSTPTMAIRKVVGGTSTYIAKAVHTFVNADNGAAVNFSPMVVTLGANSYLSLYMSLATAETKAEGCWLTAVYLGE